MTDLFSMLFGMFFVSSICGWLLAFYWHRQFESRNREFLCVQHQNHSNHATFSAMKARIAYLEGQLQEDGDGEEWKGPNGNN